MNSAPTITIYNNTAGNRAFGHSLEAGVFNETVPQARGKLLAAMLNAPNSSSMYVHPGDTNTIWLSPGIFRFNLPFGRRLLTLLDGVKLIGAGMDVTTISFQDAELPEVAPLRAEPTEREAARHRQKIEERENIDKRAGFQLNNVMLRDMTLTVRRNDGTLGENFPLRIRASAEKSVHVRLVRCAFESLNGAGIIESDDGNREVLIDALECDDRTGHGFKFSSADVCRVRAVRCSGFNQQEILT